MVEKRRRSGRSWRGVLAALLTIGAVAPIVISDVAVRPANRAEAAGEQGASIEILADSVSGADGPAVDINGDVTWANQSGRTVVVTLFGGALTSGPVPDGGSFVAAFPVAGRFEWTVDEHAPPGDNIGSGILTVAADFVDATGLPADGEALVNDSIPDVPLPPPDLADIDLHPDLLTELPRSTAVVGFTDTATVREARNAIRQGGWDVVGAIPEFKLLYLRLSFRSGSDFSQLERAIDVLLANPAVEFASFVFPSEATIVPEPSSDAAGTDWYWEPASIDAAGVGDNWGLELSRVPQAWNLNDAVRQRSGEPRPGTLVVDAGFESHPDLSGVQRLRLCKDFNFVALSAGECTTTQPSDHGNSVAGIIAAEHDGVGTDGVDPLSRVFGVSWLFDSPDGSIKADAKSAMSAAFRQMQGGLLSNIRVINMSFRESDPKPGGWWERYGDERCGPGANDDATGTELCYPDTHDAIIARHAESGKKWRRVFEAFTMQLEKPPLFVVATGNDSLSYCQPHAVPCALGTGHSYTAMSDTQWASRNWRSEAGANPIILAESIGAITKLDKPREGRASLSRSEYSNIGGDISASGMTTAPSSSEGKCREVGVTPGYCFSMGTSNAAPFISGVAGLLVNWDPTLGAADIRETLTRWAANDTTGGAAPRVDAYASLLSLDGAAHAIADVNDPSLDGNRRVVRAADGTETSDATESTSGVGYSEPDGVVDMRDFRRFRDAWLVRCGTDPEAGCPGPDQVSLDGGAGHPKLDLNGDGCVALNQPSASQACPSELTYSRFDFNGDGVLSVNDAAIVPLQSDGTPAEAVGKATTMTDLDMLESQWDADAPGAQGYVAGDLEALLRSADLTLVADGFASTGAATASVLLQDGSTGETITSFAIDVDADAGADNAPVITVPVNRTYQLDIAVNGPSGTCSHVIGPLELQVGEDRRIDLDASLQLTAPDRLRLEENVPVLLSASSCGGSVANVAVDLSVSPDVPLGASVPSSALLDGAGAAEATFSTGALTGRYEIVARATLPVAGSATREITARTSVFVADDYFLEVAAAEGTGSQYSELDRPLDQGGPIGPSINAAGSVAFGALADTGTDYTLRIAARGATPTQLATAVAPNVFGAGAHIIGDPELNDAGQIAFTTETVTGVNSASFVSETRVHLADAAGNVVELASGELALGNSAADYETVGRPTINADGRVVFVADNQLAERTDAGLIVVGPPTPLARPQLADDGTSVTSADISRPCSDFPGLCGPNQFLLFDPIILVGPDLQPTRSIIAEGRVDGWEELSNPDISPTGDVIAFVGIRNGQTGLWVSLRHPVSGQWQAPQLVEGPAAGGRLVSLDLQRPTVLHFRTGPGNLSADRVLVTVVGAESGVAGPAGNGVFVVPVDLAGDASGNTQVIATAQQPQLVAQVGDVIDGRTVDAVRLADSLAAATTPRNVDDHWVAFFASSAAGDMYVRGQPVLDDQAAAVARPFARPFALSRFAAPDQPTEPNLQVVQQSGADKQGFSGPTARAALTATSFQAAPATDVPVITAATFSTLEPAAGSVLTVTNRSIDIDGMLTEAVLDDRGDESPPTLLAPGGSTQIVYDSPRRTTITVAAPVEQTRRGTDLVVSFRVGPGPDRPPGAELPAEVVVPIGAEVSLLAVVDDPDFAGTVHTWDIGNDGTPEFVDQVTYALVVPAADVGGLFCGGICFGGDTVDVGLAVTDSRGLTAEATTTVRFSDVADFDVSVAPSLLRVEPGATGQFFVDVTGIDGFASEVELRFVDVPAGWIVSSGFSIRPGGSAGVTVRPPVGTDVAQAVIGVVGTAAGREHRADLTVTTAFGLIPRCSATITVTVTDAGGAPIPGAFVRLGFTAQADAAGVVTFRPDLPEGVEVIEVPLTVRAEGFISSSARTIRYGCDDDMTADVELQPVTTGTVIGRVVEGRYNPIVNSDVLATDTPVADAVVSVSSADSSATSSGGGFELTVEASTDGTFGARNYRATKDGYWDTDVRGTVGATGELDLGDIPILAKCTATLPGGRVVDQFGIPMAGVTVRLSGSNQAFLTDADGRFTLDDVELARNNQPRNYSVAASTLGLSGIGVVPASQVRQEVVRCGEVLPTVELQLERIDLPIDRFGDLEGQATDLDTGLPLADVFVTVFNLDDDRLGITQTDATGRYAFASLLLGATQPDDDQPLVAGMSVRASPTASHFGSAVRVNLTSDESRSADLQLERRRYGPLSGQVVDVESGDPLPGAEIVVARNLSSFDAIADEQGRYSFDRLPVGRYDVTASKRDPDTRRFTHWASFDRVFVVEDPAAVHDPALLRICAGGTVSGVVVDATDLSPLADVSIRIGSLRTETGPDGSFTIVDVPVADGNGSNDVVVTASKAGFFTASVGITVFCGSTTVVDFGTPSTQQGVIVGTVTDDAGPVVGAFVGSGFGAATTTGSDGTFRLEQVPLNPDESPRSWTVTVIDGDRRVERAVLVPATPEAVVDVHFDGIDPDPVPPTAIVFVDDADEPQDPAVLITGTVGTPVLLDASQSEPGSSALLTYTWSVNAEPGATGSIVGAGQAGQLVLQSSSDPVIELSADAPAVLTVDLVVASAANPTLSDSVSFDVLIEPLAVVPPTTSSPPGSTIPTVTSPPAPTLPDGSSPPTITPTSPPSPLPTIPIVLDNLPETGNSSLLLPLTWALAMLVLGLVLLIVRRRPTSRRS